MSEHDDMLDYVSPGPKRRIEGVWMPKERYEAERERVRQMEQAIERLEEENEELRQENDAHRAALIEETMKEIRSGGGVVLSSEREIRRHNRAIVERAMAEVEAEDAKEQELAHLRAEVMRLTGELRIEKASQATRGNN